MAKTRFKRTQPQAIKALNLITNLKNTTTMKNVKLELNALELLNLKHAIKNKAREHFEDNRDEIRSGSSFNYNINSISDLMQLYDKICKAYNESLKEE